jgi:thiamine-monophosphate kinase
MKIKDLGEEGLLKLLLGRFKSSNKDIIVPPGDDAAVVKFSVGKYCAFTTDLLIENVHFNLKTTSPFDLGYKSLAVNLSDLAAMSAIPKFAQIGLGIPGETEVDFLEKFYDGFLSCADKFETSITGGDVSMSEKFLVSVTAIGEVDYSSITRRSDAKIDDVICVTGNLGSSAAGLKLLNEPSKFSGLSVKSKDELISAHLKPFPRVKEALAISKIGVNAMEDISDGLAADLRHICELSGAGAVVFEKSLPTSAAFKEFCELRGRKCVDLAFRGGEDYELLFTASSESAEKITKQLNLLGVDMSVVGKILPEETGIYIERADGQKEALTGGYNHFKD